MTNQKRDGWGGRRPGAGRPAGSKNKKGVNPTTRLRLEPSILEGIDNAAEKMGLDRSRLVNRILATWLSGRFPE